ncbi:MAG TPA: type II toxin-antitoxin system RelE/ParE family toxin [Pyrinomonadaceae bacterium]|nr:type II toxin-antitoxin system RelE/ParE family toxin [Pyrinomonadaceae bacterium]
MAEIVWTEPALSDLDAIADYIAVENPEAAKRLVRKVFITWNN